MNGRLSAFLGTAVGLALAALLLVPDADRQTLVAQAVGKLLRSQQDVYELGLKTAREAGESVPSSVPEGVSAAETLPAALARLGGDLDDPAVALTVRVDGELRVTPATVSNTDPFARAVTTELNLLTAARENDSAERKLETPPRFRLAKPDETAPLEVELTVHVDEARITVTASVAGGGAFAAVVPPDDGWVDAEGTIHETHKELPDRLSLVPPLLAILVALLLRKTLLALFLGILSGSVLILWDGGAGWGESITQGFANVFTHYFWAEFTDSFRFEIIGFVVLLVAMVGILSRSGGVQGLIELLIGFAKTARSTLFATWGMGLIIFFDDYANCLLVGNTMRPLTDRMRISREKLAYIVDATAAPVAGVSMLSTWIAYEVSTYQAHLPGAGITENAYAIFLQTIPFRFYCLFTLIFVFLTIALGRDFGPMLKAEVRARTTGKLVRDGGMPMVSDEASRITPYEGLPHRWWAGAGPIALVLFTTLAIIFLDGKGVQAWNEGALGDPERIADILFAGSGGKPIFIGAFVGLASAMLISGSNAVRLGTLLGLGVATGLQDLSVQWLGDLSFVREGAGFGLFLQQTTSYLAFGLVFSITMLVVVVAATLGGLRTKRPHLPGGEMTRAGLSSAKALVFAVIILFEAWMIGRVCQEMDTADYLVALLSGAVPPLLLPVLLFTAACLVAFATGSSWSTMAILLPNVVALSAAVGEAAGIGALAMVVVCIGAVLEGSIFGDHCSPISDTTVLSSVASASDHVDHVRTQAPYAIVVATLAIVLGYLPTVELDWWSTPLALGSATLVITALLFLVGRKVPDATFADLSPGSDAER
ncbi:MAG: hypothetical protein H6825_14995 [Planctomycetes bacterium]|nr:hypothetical protein [Planctomycetota bacterium]